MGSATSSSGNSPALRTYACRRDQYEAKILNASKMTAEFSHIGIKRRRYATPRAAGLCLFKAARRGRAVRLRGDVGEERNPTRDTPHWWHLPAARNSARVIRCHDRQKSAKHPRCARIAHLAKVLLVLQGQLDRAVREGPGSAHDRSSPTTASAQVVGGSVPVVLAVCDDTVSVDAPMNAPAPPSRRLR